MTRAAEPPGPAAPRAPAAPPDGGLPHPPAPLVPTRLAGTEVPSALLDRFPQFSDLGLAARYELARRSALYQLPPAQAALLEPDGEHRFYLISGRLDPVGSKSADQRPLRAGGEAAAGPLPHGIDLWRSPRGAYLMQVPVPAPIAARPAQLEGLEAIVDNALEHEQFWMPSMPQVAARLRRSLRDPDVGVDEVEAIIQSDPGVATATLHAANSPLFCGGAPARDLRQAIVRLGLLQVQSLALSIGMSSVFNARSDQLKERIRSRWRQALLIATFSSALARHSEAVAPDRALLAGLSHLVGEVAILCYLDRFRLPWTDTGLARCLASQHHSVGAGLMERWELGDDLATTCEEYLLHERRPRRPDPCAIVQLALFYQARQRYVGRAPKLEDCPAFRSAALRLPAGPAAWLARQYRIARDTAEGLPALGS